MSNHRRLPKGSDIGLRGLWMQRKHLYEHLEGQWGQCFQAGAKVMAKALRQTYFHMAAAGSPKGRLRG